MRRSCQPIPHTYIDQGLTAHGQTVAEEVTRVGDKDDQARLDLRVLVQAGMLEH